MQASLLTNSKQITEIKAKNKQGEGPLKMNRKLRDDMKYALRQHAKDQMSLANLKLKITSLRDRIRKLEREQEEIDARFGRVLQEKKGLEHRFENITMEVKAHAELKNDLLSKRLADLEDQLEYKVKTFFDVKKLILSQRKLNCNNLSKEPLLIHPLPINYYQRSNNLLKLRMVWSRTSDTLSTMQLK